MLILQRAVQWRAHAGCCSPLTACYLDVHCENDSEEIGDVN